MSAGTQGSQKRALDPLKLELQTIVSQMWMLITELGFSARLVLLASEPFF